MAKTWERLFYCLMVCFLTFFIFMIPQVSSDEPVDTAHINVTIGGTQRNATLYTLTPGQSTRVYFAGVNTGPVKVASDVSPDYVLGVTRS